MSVHVQRAPRVQEASSLRQVTPIVGNQVHAGAFRALAAVLLLDLDDDDPPLVGELAEEARDPCLARLARELDPHPRLRVHLRLLLLLPWVLPP
eukprot:CAMPEP_0206243554 /NCGR_PEP_ID=MMETSP0047_2-20121206/17668_1 /ASSEMBLY_ACC=CAM_ASM_000192 /TAXON_ID=195065 /ORGANISM="Chroomonas mesostigmatica_cf, Strain CCMP1168" /LENGTH=93 /DNA_ID=CAMNT_0053668679 /DNA_START=143 /DNA_END=421 /DNA_ORIENTATION=+